jgi:CRP-like cAMP-binding protein
VKPDDLDSLPLLSELGDAARAAVADELEALPVESGTLLFDEGGERAGLLIVVEGSVRVSSPATGEVTVLGPGSALGALSLITGGAHRARAETASRTSLLRLSPAGYRRLADAEPHAACDLLEAIAREAARLAWNAIGDPCAASAPAAGGAVDRDTDGA